MGDYIALVADGLVNPAGLT